MGYVLKAVLSSAQHPEYGQITIPFPVPDEEYGCMIELLEPLEIGDALQQDCRVDELDSFYTVLNRLVGSLVNFDELDYKVSADDLVKLQRIRKAAEQGEFDILLVFMYDRLGRNLNETPFIAEWFTKKGIHVWSVYEGEIIDGVDAERMLDYIRFWQTDEAQKL